MSITILIADDHKIVRDGLHALIKKHKDLEVVAKAETGREAVTQALEKKPDIIIMDISMPDLDGIEATQQIVSKLSGIKIIAISQHSDKHFITGMLQAGAKGYLLKECAFEQLLLAIKAVINGHIYLSPFVTDIVVKEYLERLSENPSSAGLLSKREIDVLQLLTEGLSVKEISAKLDLSIKTTETYIQRIKEKLNLHSTAELTKYAIKQGLTSPEP